MPLPSSQSLIHIRQLAAGALAPGKTLAALRYRLQGRAVEAERHQPPVLERIVPKEVAFKEMSFTFAVIALCAHVACLDGPLSKQKYLIFRDAFPLSGGLCGKLRRLFALACENKAPYAHYVSQIKHAYPKQSPLFISLVERLFCIASADGPVSPKSEHTLAKISHMLGLTPSQYTDIRSRHYGPARAHDVLGVAKRTPLEKIKKRYREMILHYHPDRFAQSTLSPEVEMLLQLKVSEINAAYQRLSRRAA